MRATFSESIGPEELTRIKSKNWYRHGVYREDSVLALVCQIYIGKEWFAKEGISKGIDHLARMGDPIYLDEQEATEFTALYAESLERNGIGYLRTYIEGHKRSNEEMVRVAQTRSRWTTRSSKLHSRDILRRCMKHRTGSGAWSF